MTGRFITIEGMDGSGKTTQIERLKTWFLERGDEVIVTREPGGTRISEAIRPIILNKDYTEMGHMTEALLYAAARSQHVEEIIKPALSAGKMVICDRFVESSIVYQGYARGLGASVVEDINRYATLGIVPDVTLFLDLDHKTGMARKKNQQELDRLEAEGSSFHELVREGYHQLLETRADRMVCIDASKSLDDVYSDIIIALESHGI